MKILAIAALFAFVNLPAMAQFYGPQPYSPCTMSSGTCTFSGGIVVQGAGAFTTLSATGAVTTSNLTLGITGTTPVQFGEINSQSSYNWPIAAAGGCCRLHYWSDTVTVTGNQAGVNVLEANFYNLITAGTGTLTNEAFNIVHPYAYIAPGINIAGYAEAFESSFLNDGTVNTMFGNLAIYTNGAAGTTGTYTAYTTNASNYNTAAGSFANYTGYECQPLGGSGSAATFRWCLVNRDSTASIVTVGGVNIGTLANSNGQGTLQIIGADSSGGTYPFFIKNGSSQNVFYVNNAGGVTVGIGDLTLTSGAVNAVNYKASGTLGVSCSAGSLNLATAVVTKGLITHC